MMYKSQQIDKIITENELEDWMDDLYIYAERNIAGYQRPADALERTIRILQLEKVNNECNVET